MSEIWLPNGGVNRKQKELWLPSGGVNRKQKELWAASGGVNRKIFSGGVGYRMSVSVSYSRYGQNSAVKNDNASGRFYLKDDEEHTNTARMDIYFDSVPRSAISDYVFQANFRYWADYTAYNGGNLTSYLYLNGSTNSVKLQYFGNGKSTQDGRVKPELQLSEIPTSVTSFSQIGVELTCKFRYDLGVFEAIWSSGDVKLFGRSLYADIGKLDIQI